MIVYTPFWKTLKEKDISTYTLITKYNVSSSTINRLRHNKPVSTTTLDDFCRFLNCSVSEIVEYIPTNDSPTDNENFEHNKCNETIKISDSKK